jgi:hypothetical protein
MNEPFWPVLLPAGFFLLSAFLIWRGSRSPLVECKWCSNICEPGETLCHSCRKAHDSPPTNNSNSGPVAG